MTRAWDKEKTESSTGIEPMTSRTPDGRSITRGEEELPYMGYIGPCRGIGYDFLIQNIDGILILTADMSIYLFLPFFRCVSGVVLT